MDKANEPVGSLNITANNIISACNDGNIYHGYCWGYYIEIYPDEELRLSPFTQYKPFYVSFYGRLNGRISKESFQNYPI